MRFRTARMLSGLFFGLAACALAHAMCPVDVVVVKGRVDHAPGNARVRVQLVYPGNLGGDSVEAILADANFTLPVEFITQSRRPLLVGTFREKCDRRPEAVIVTLVGGDPPQEYDRVSLELPGDFRKTDSNTYALRSEIVMKGCGDCVGKSGIPTDAPESSRSYPALKRRASFRPSDAELPRQSFSPFALIALSV